MLMYVSITLFVGNMQPVRNPTTEGGPSYPGYVPITTAGVVTKVAWPSGMPPPPPNFFEFPDHHNRQDYSPHSPSPQPYHQY